jgi:cell division protein FtsI (penicillin-binding protein 3)
MLRRLKNWEATSIGSVAMGHEIGTTSVQLALAGAVVANGGMLVKPRLILARQTPGGPEQRYSPEKPERVVAPQTAITMRQMMEGVVLHGTGKGQAILRGYTSGGKTGSAQIYDFKTHTYTHHYNASFLGFAPVANPQIVIAVTLVGTSGGGAGFGGAVAAPVFRQVATSALRMLDVPKDLPDTKIRAKNNTTDENDVAIAGLGAPPVELSPGFDIARGASIAGSQSVSSVTPPPAQGGSSTPANEPALDRRPFLSARTAIGPRVPDFRGMTLRSVLEESAATRTPVEVLGEGMARDQDPPPGAVLTPGARVRVQFSR